ncbi:MAG: hypothetical protein LH702_20940, partial [Phormidesmis sp. CAN_BIN44]|nr:hypothetical protein [Phormidesmis sp. CAN_BIN44]
MSLHLIQVGVGALIAFGSVGAAHSQTSPSGQPQKSPNLTTKSPNLKMIAATFEDKAALMREPSAIAQIAQTFRDNVQKSAKPKKLPSLLAQATKPRSQPKSTISEQPSLEAAKIVQFFANALQKAPDPAVAQAPKPVTPPRSTPLPPSNSPTSSPRPPATTTPAPGTPAPTPTTSKSDPTP